jgi:hypothetical protein
MSPTRSRTSTSTSTSGPAPSVTRIGSDTDGYRIPVVGASVPARMVETGFWGGLLGAAVLGAIDPPLALLVGAGVAIARHRRS